MSEETPKIYKSICAVMSEINAIGKDSYNKTQNFRYRGIDDVMNELHAALANNSVFVVPQVLEENRSTGKSKSGGELYYTRLKIKFVFYAEDGSHVDAVVIGEAMDSGDKASNKALSVGLKYAMLQVFCIPTEDEKDPDGQSHEPQAGSMKAAPKKAEKPKIPPFTPDEEKELADIFATKYQDGSPVFSDNAKKFFDGLRADFAARVIIDRARAECDKRLKAAEKEKELPPQVEAAREAVGGEVVEQPAQDELY